MTKGLLVEDEVEIIVQVNGKVRDRFRAPLGANEEELKATALGVAENAGTARRQTNREGRGCAEQACQPRHELAT
jgi:Leucyl-tRNA synthetase